MGNFAENLNLGNRFRPPLTSVTQCYAALYFETTKVLFELCPLVMWQVPGRQSFMISLGLYTWQPGHITSTIS